ncbi:hypothetical protein HPB47_017273 [Ixodes persulcatus]|uniref:Uncharacterized protein n=1 Tax=Ixodes persulcatus TaxID=34615 RepID=A0AC60QNX8_IXOPE|nr:hypothetical protein HPB47_017273 [Ixodes persulcatus]
MEADRTASIPVFVPPPVTTEDVAAAISQLKPGASPGPDGIPPFLLKACAAALSSPSADLYNYSFSRALIPDVWKLAHVTPVHKGTGKPLNSLKSYRPISLTCILCKIFETLICSKISTHLEVNNLFCSSQHGFRKGRSCETLLSLLHHDLSSALDSSKEADVLSIDFSKAFGSVNHDHILTKLLGFGISGATLKWVSNFLVYFNKCASSDQVLVPCDASACVSVNASDCQGGTVRHPAGPCGCCDACVRQLGQGERCYHSKKEKSTNHTPGECKHGIKCSAVTCNCEGPSREEDD